MTGCRHPRRVHRPGRKRESATTRKRLYVGNIPYQTREAQHRALIQESRDQDQQANIDTDRETGRPGGFAFVEMTTDAEAETAVGALNGKSFGGRPLTVSEARDRMTR